MFRIQDIEGDKELYKLSCEEDRKAGKIIAVLSVLLLVVTVVL